jgi:hypothetical protein
VGIIGIWGVGSSALGRRRTEFVGVESERWKIEGLGGGLPQGRMIGLLRTRLQLGQFGGELETAVEYGAESLLQGQTVSRSGPFS